MYLQLLLFFQQLERVQNILVGTVDPLLTVVDRLLTVIDQARFTFVFFKFQRPITDRDFQL